MYSNFQNKKVLLRGLLTAIVLALAAKFLSSHYKAPAMLFALLLGLSFHFVYRDLNTRQGIDITADLILKLAVGLLGFRLSFDSLQNIGFYSIFLVFLMVFLTIGFGLVLAKIFKKELTFGILSGGSVAICGASAALAIFSVLPRSPFGDRDMALVVVGVTILSTLAMISYPIIFASLGMNDFASGFIIGASIHDVAQVVGAGYSISDEAGIIATFIKMLRVSLLPLVIIMLIASMNRSGSEKIKLPWFLILFFSLAAIKNLIPIPFLVTQSIGNISSWLLLISIAAIGVKTNLAAVTSVSYVYGVILILETLFLLLLSLGSLHILTFLN